MSTALTLSKFITFIIDRFFIIKNWRIAGVFWFDRGIHIIWITIKQEVSVIKIIKWWSQKILNLHKKYDEFNLSTFLNRINIWTSYDLNLSGSVQFSNYNFPCRASMNIFTKRENIFKIINFIFIDSLKVKTKCLT